MKRKGEGSKPPKPKKNKVDPLQQSLLPARAGIADASRAARKKVLLRGPPSRSTQ